MIALKVFTLAMVMIIMQVRGNMNIIDRIVLSFGLHGFNVLDVRHGNEWVAFEFGSRHEAELALPHFKPD